MRITIAAGAALALAGLAGAANAGWPTPVKMTCPVGGQTFTFIDTASYSTWGRRADGKPYGSWEFPKPLAECPGNRLVIFTHFTPEQIKQLKPILASPEYKALASETTYYRTRWLGTALKIPSVPDVWLLLQASWQADGDPARKARYQRELLTAIDAEPVAADHGWFVNQLRAVNTERELGQFDAATARIARLREALSKPSPYADDKTPDATPEDNEAARKNQLVTLDKQALVIARQDAGSEPLELITPRIAARKCIGLIDAKQVVPEICETAEMRGAISRERTIQKAGEEWLSNSGAATSPSTPVP